MSALIRLEGRRFGRLQVISQAETRHYSSGRIRIFWLCRCDCGGEREIASRCLIQGRSRSCGCFRIERGHLNATHGKSHMPEFGIWTGMIRRCTNPLARGYKYYGGRGIKVCDSWLNSFESFYSSVGPRISPKHSIDRINNDGNYEPGNVRWATWYQQAKNRRRRKSKFAAPIPSTVIA